MGWRPRGFRECCWLMALGATLAAGACSGSGHDTLTGAGGSAGSAGGPTTCDDSLGCVGQPNRRTICDTTRHECVECVADPDCVGDELCVANECRTSCDSDNDCTPLGLLCDLDQGFCARGSGSGGSGGSGDGGESNGSGGRGGTAGSKASGGSGGSEADGGSAGSGASGGTSGSGGTGGAGCLPPNVVVLLDRSHSTATEMIGNVTRLQAVKDALAAIVPSRSDVRFGLHLSQGADAACTACTMCADGSVYVAPSDSSAAAVTTVVDATLHCEVCGSPNGESLAALANYAPLKDALRDNYVVLIVDGEAGCADPVPAISALASADPAVKTFVLLIGSDVATEDIAPLAVAGGTTTPYLALNQGDVELLLNEILDQVACP